MDERRSGPKSTVVGEAEALDLVGIQKVDSESVSVGVWKVIKLSSMTLTSIDFNLSIEYLCVRE